MQSVEEQRAWWKQELAELGIDPATVLDHARVGARLLPDADGSCALAGVPRMPNDWQWPTWNGRPLRYVARVSLPALAATLDPQARHGLAGVGDLHLFVDALGDGWGYDPQHRGSFAAYIADGDRDFATPRAEHPEYGVIELEYPQREMALAPELVLPSLAADEAPQELSEEQDSAYLELFDEFNDAFFDGALRHRICGLPDIIQNPMERECQLVTNGLDLGRGDYDKQRAKGLEPGVAQWRLLAQLDTDEDLGMFWGDTGCIYWWLREPDFAAGRVDRCWGIVQVT
jgi:uncharacterized protein YwqG